jgi:hypothetical protein
MLEQQDKAAGIPLRGRAAARARAGT